MKHLALVAGLGALAIGLHADAALAQSQQQIPVRKDAPSISTTTTTTDDVTFTGPLGYSLRPGGSPVYCRPEDAAEVAKVAVKTDKFVSGMISADQAKAVALCAVPGQIASGEMDSFENRPTYQISILPTGKQTYSKVDVDAYTGEILNAKQFGGLRGLAGYLRESMQRKNNKVAPY